MKNYLCIHCMLVRHVFFSVAANSEESYNSGDTIRFPHVFASVGGGWDEETHRFSCPVTGYYLFTVSLWKNYNPFNNYNCEADLYKENSRQIHVSNYEFTDARVSYTSSAHAILPCNQGEEVWMRMGSTCWLWDSSLHVNQMSGLLVKPGQ